MKSASEIAKMSDADLNDFLKTVPEGRLDRQVAFEEFTRRRLLAIEKGHWTLVWGFRVMVATLIAAAIAAWPVIREWFPR